jgi:hypothetical protein
MSIEKNTTSRLKHIGGGFTTIQNETLDKIPTNSALGVYVYLASKPEDWIIRDKDIQRRFGIGKKALETCLKTLKEVGLYEKVSIRNPNGTVKVWISNLYITPKAESEIDHNTENRHSGSIHNTPYATCGLNQKVDKELHTNNIMNTKERKNTNTSSDDDEDGDFCEFWTGYPKKVGKKQSKKAWGKLSKKTRKQVIEDIAKRKENNWKGKHSQFIPNPASYLTNERWEDAIIAYTEISLSRSYTARTGELKSTVPDYKPQNFEIKPRSKENSNIWNDAVRKTKPYKTHI